MGSLSFLNPIFLIALPAVGIPVLIHLINRRRARVIDFAAIDFVLRSHRRIASSWRLRQILLLMARIGAVLMLVLSFARPYFTTLASSRGPVNLAVVVDDSYSMGYRHGGLTSFERAVSGAEHLLRSLRADDNAALLVGERRQGLTPNINGLIEELKSSRCSYGSSDIAGWLSNALDMLGGSQLANKHITLFTDLAEHGWAAEKFAPIRERMEQAGCTVAVVDTGAEQPANAAVAELKATFSADDRRTAEVAAAIANFGARDITGLRCELSVDGKSAAVGFADVPAGSKIEKTFACEAAPGKPLKAQLEIGADPLPADNIRYLILQAPTELRALLVDGSPGRHTTEAETFYLERALRADEEGRRQITPVVVTTGEMRAEELGGYDVLFLCNVPFLSESDCGRLNRFLEHGGGLFVSLGDMVEEHQYNSAMRTLIPRALWDVKEFPGGDAHIGEMDRNHPVFKVFLEPDLENLRSAVFERIYLLEPGVDTSTRVLLSLKNGMPLLVESRRGPGRVILFASSINRAWNNLPILPTFLPLMRELTKYLGRISDNPPRRNLLVGQPQELSSEDADTVFEITSPGGRHERLGPAKSATYRDTFVPGIYEVEPRQPFAVNLDTTTESDLTKIPATRLGGLLGDRMSVAKSVGAEGQFTAGIRTPIWGKLLAALLLLVLAESLLARKV